MEIITETITPTVASIGLVAVSGLIWYLKPAVNNTNTILLASHLDQKSRQKKFATDARGLLREAKEKGDSLIRITTAGGQEITLVSKKHVEELKDLADDQLDILKAVSVSLEGDYTLVAKEPFPLLMHAMKSDLTPSLGRLMPVIVEEIDLVLAKNMPACEEWKALNIHSTLLNLVTQISARVFVGLPLCRDQRWLDLTRDYTVLLFQASQSLQQYSPWLRPLMSYFNPELKELLKVRQEAIAFMKPISQHRQEAHDDVRDDFTEWVKNRASEEWSRDYEKQAEQQITLAMAAIHTTTMTATHILHQLLEHPEYIDILREEVKSVLAESSGTFTKDIIGKLRKMDSFMRETARHKGTGLTTFKRKTLKDITLSDGTFIPANTFIEIPVENLSSEQEKFDGLRSYKIRENSEEEGLTEMFTTSNSSNLHWGAGRHACPGRFFAAIEIKSILAKMLLSYDLKKDEETAGQPTSITFGTSVSPNPMVNIMFKRSQE